MTEPLVPTNAIAVSQKTLSQNNVGNRQSLLDASPQEDALRWSRHVLRGNESQQSSDVQLSDSNSPDSAELLRLLAKRDYFLSRDETDAFLTLGQPTSPSLTTRIRERMSHRGKTLRLTEAVNEFAREFFDIPCDERADQWNRLYERCLNEPGLLRRLDELTPALDAEKPQPTGDEHYDRLVEVAAKVFSLPPDEGARLRQQFLVDALEKPEDWIGASRKLHSKLTYFSKYVAEWTCPLMEPAASKVKQESVPKRPVPAQQVREPIRAREPVNTNQSKFPYWGLVFVVIILLRIISAVTKNSAPSPQTTGSGFNRPTERVTSDETLNALRDSRLSPTPAYSNEELDGMPAHLREVAFQRYPALRVSYDKYKNVDQARQGKSGLDAAEFERLSRLTDEERRDELKKHPEKIFNHIDYLMKTLKRNSKR